MKILLSNSFFFPALGGIENYLLNISRILIKEGHKVTIFTYAHEEGLKLEDKIDGIRVIRFAKKNLLLKLRFFEPYYLLSSFLKEAEYFLHNEIFDLYIVRDLFSLAAVYNAVRLPKIIYIQATAYPIYIKQTLKNYGDSIFSKLYWTIYKFFWSAYLGKLEKSYTLKIRLVCVLSKAKLNEISSFYQIPQNHYCVIYPGVDHSKYFVIGSNNNKRLLREKLNIPLDKIIVLYVGRFEKEKNPEAILKCMKMIDINPLHFIFIGNPTISFLNIIKENHLEKKVTLTGPIPEPCEYYRCSDIFVLPSLSEGFGQVILEAMSSGLPVIAFSNPKNEFILATDEIIQQNKTGILVDYEDYKGMASVLNSIESNITFFRKMGKEAEIFAKENFSWEKTIKKLLEVNEQDRINIK
jgi:1,2-diacylglycerol 3-alpha-glucosyltransferase